MSSRLMNAHNLLQKVRKKKYLSTVADEDLVQEQLKAKNDEGLVNDVTAHINELSSDITDSEIEIELKRLEMYFEEKGVEPTDELMLRELACRTNRINDLADYKQLLWDPKKNVVGESTGILTKKLSNLLPSGRLNDFSIEKVKDGTGPAVIAINGFMSQGKDDSEEWIDAVKHSPFHKSPVYLVNWDSGSLNHLLSKISLGIKTKNEKVDFAIDLFGLGTMAVGGVAKLAGSFIGGLIASWYSALSKAEKVGSTLSYIVQCTDHDDGFIIMGHSLGARVNYYLLKDLAEVKKDIVVASYLLGGAVGASNNKQEWSEVEPAVQTKIYNLYSEHDVILGFLYRLSTAGTSKPIGLTEIDSEKVVNLNVSRNVSGHTKHKENFRPKIV